MPIEGTLPDTLYLGPTKCGYAPDRISAEDRGISAAHREGATLVYVEG